MNIVMRYFLLGTSILLGLVALSIYWNSLVVLLIVAVGIFLLGLIDLFQTHHTVLRNFPIVGHFRYWLEMIRPEIQQYFIETYENGRPFSREQRSVVYQRGKRELDTLPFGTMKDLYEPGVEWINHSLIAKALPKKDPRVVVGNGSCKKPYSASILNVSAMSFGSLSPNAIEALNLGAKLGNFAHNTGEGAISSHHLKNGGDLIWQIGTGYFGCRMLNGRFDPKLFEEKASHDTVKMIELKLSQGAKPGHGGILPGVKVTEEISKIRGVPIGQTVISPPSHVMFDNPIGMLEFIQQLRELSGGKPVGIKHCIGKRREFFAICKAMNKTGIYPDFITVDGAEGGTGAAPVEFANSIGTPLNDGLIFAHNALVGTNLRKHIKVIVSGKISTGFHIAAKIALGADLTNAARAMMFALGCIQALRCNTNHCPTGVATLNPDLVRGLVVKDKAPRVANFHQGTVESFIEVLAAAGLTTPDELRPWHIQRRIDFSTVKHYGDIYEYLEEGQLVAGEIPQPYQRAWQNSTAESF